MFSFLSSSANNAINGTPAPPNSKQLEQQQQRILDGIFNDSMDRLLLEATKHCYTHTGPLKEKCVWMLRLRDAVQLAKANPLGMSSPVDLLYMFVLAAEVLHHLVYFDYVGAAIKKNNMTVPLEANQIKQLTPSSTILATFRSLLIQSISNIGKLLALQLVPQTPAVTHLICELIKSLAFHCGCGKEALTEEGHMAGGVASSTLKLTEDPPLLIALLQLLSTIARPSSGNNSQSRASDMTNQSSLVEQEDSPSSFNNTQQPYQINNGAGQMNNMATWHVWWTCLVLWQHLSPYTKEDMEAEASEEDSDEGRGGNMVSSPENATTTSSETVRRSEEHCPDANEAAASDRAELSRLSSSTRAVGLVESSSNVPQDQRKSTTLHVDASGSSSLAFATHGSGASSSTVGGMWKTEKQKAPVRRQKVASTALEAPHCQYGEEMCRTILVDTIMECVRMISKPDDDQQQKTLNECQDVGRGVTDGSKRTHSLTEVRHAYLFLKNVCRLIAWGASTQRDGRGCENAASLRTVHDHPCSSHPSSPAASYSRSSGSMQGVSEGVAMEMEKRFHAYPFRGSSWWLPPACLQQILKMQAEKPSPSRSFSPLEALTPLEVPPAASQRVEEMMNTLFRPRGPSAAPSPSSATGSKSHTTLWGQSRSGSVASECGEPLAVSATSGVATTGRTALPSAAGMGRSVEEEFDFLSSSTRSQNTRTSTVLGAASSGQVATAPPTPTMLISSRAGSRGATTPSAPSPLAYLLVETLLDLHNKVLDEDGVEGGETGGGVNSLGKNDPAALSMSGIKIDGAAGKKHTFDHYDTSSGWGGVIQYGRISLRLLLLDAIHAGMEEVHAQSHGEKENRNQAASSERSREDAFLLNQFISEDLLRVALMMTCRSSEFDGEDKVGPETSANEFEDEDEQCFQRSHAIKLPRYHTGLFQRSQLLALRSMCRALANESSNGSGVLAALQALLSYQVNLCADVMLDLLPINSTSAWSGGSLGVTNGSGVSRRKRLLQFGSATGVKSKGDDAAERNIILQCKRSEVLSSVLSLWAEELYASAEGPSSSSSSSNCCSVLKKLLPLMCKTSSAVGVSMVGAGGVGSVEHRQDHYRHDEWLPSSFVLPKSGRERVQYDYLDAPVVQKDSQWSLSSVWWKQGIPLSNPDTIFSFAHFAAQPALYFHFFALCATFSEIEEDGGADVLLPIESESVHRHVVFFLHQLATIEGQENSHDGELRTASHVWKIPLLTAMTIIQSCAAKCEMKQRKLLLNRKVSFHHQRSSQKKEPETGEIHWQSIPGSLNSLHRLSCSLEALLALPLTRTSSCDKLEVVEHLGHVFRLVFPCLRMILRFADEEAEVYLAHRHSALNIQVRQKGRTPPPQSAGKKDPSLPGNNENERGKEKLKKESTTYPYRSETPIEDSSDAETSSADPYFPCYFLFQNVVGCIFSYSRLSAHLTAMVQSFDSAEDAAGSVDLTRKTKGVQHLKAQATFWFEVSLTILSSPLVSGVSPLSSVAASVAPSFFKTSLAAMLMEKGRLEEGRNGGFGHDISSFRQKSAADDGSVVVKVALFNVLKEAGLASTLFSEAVSMPEENQKPHQEKGSSPRSESRVKGSPERYGSSESHVSSPFTSMPSSPTPPSKALDSFSYPDNAATSGASMAATPLVGPNTGNAASNTFTIPSTKNTVMKRLLDTLRVGNAARNQENGNVVVDDHKEQAANGQRGNNGNMNSSLSATVRAATSAQHKYLLIRGIQRAHHQMLLLQTLIEATWSAVWSLSKSNKMSASSASRYAVSVIVLVIQHLDTLIAWGVLLCGALERLTATRSTPTHASSHRHHHRHSHHGRSGSTPLTNNSSFEREKVQIAYHQLYHRGNRVQQLVYWLCLYQSIPQLDNLTSLDGSDVWTTHQRRYQQFLQQVTISLQLPHAKTVSEAKTDESKSVSVFPSLSRLNAWKRWNEILLLLVLSQYQHVLYLYWMQENTALSMSVDDEEYRSLWKHYNTLLGITTIATEALQRSVCHPNSLFSIACEVTSLASGSDHRGDFIFEGERKVGNPQLDALECGGDTPANRLSSERDDSEGVTGDRPSASVTSSSTAKPTPVNPPSTPHQMESTIFSTVDRALWFAMVSQPLLPISPISPGVPLWDSGLLPIHPLSTSDSSFFSVPPSWGSLPSLSELCQVTSLHRGVEGRLSGILNGVAVASAIQTKWSTAATLGLRPPTWEEAAHSFGFSNTMFSSRLRPSSVLDDCGPLAQSRFAEVAEVMLVPPPLAQLFALCPSSVGRLGGAVSKDAKPHMQPVKEAQDQPLAQVPNTLPLHRLQRNSLSQVQLVELVARVLSHMDVSGSAASTTLRRLLADSIFALSFIGPSYEFFSSGVQEWNRSRGISDALSTTHHPVFSVYTDEQIFSLVTEMGGNSQPRGRGQIGEGKNGLSTENSLEENSLPPSAPHRRSHRTTKGEQQQKLLRKHRAHCLLNFTSVLIAQAHRNVIALIQSCGESVEGEEEVWFEWLHTLRQNLEPLLFEEERKALECVAEATKALTFRKDSMKSLLSSVRRPAWKLVERSFRTVDFVQQNCISIIQPHVRIMAELLLCEGALVRYQECTSFIFGRPSEEVAPAGKYPKEELFFVEAPLSGGKENANLSTSSSSPQRLHLHLSSIQMLWSAADHLASMLVHQLRAVSDTANSQLALPHHGVSKSVSMLWPVSVSLTLNDQLFLWTILLKTLYDVAQRDPRKEVRQSARSSLLSLWRVYGAGGAGHVGGRGGAGGGGTTFEDENISTDGVLSRLQALLPSSSSISEVKDGAGSHPLASYPLWSWLWESVVAGSLVELYVMQKLCMLFYDFTDMVGVGNTEVNGVEGKWLKEQDNLRTHFSFTALFSSSFPELTALHPAMMDCVHRTEKEVWTEVMPCLRALLAPSTHAVLLEILSSFCELPEKQGSSRFPPTSFFSAYDRYYYQHRDDLSSTGTEQPTTLTKVSTSSSRAAVWLSCLSSERSSSNPYSSVQIDQMVVELLDAVSRVLLESFPQDPLLESSSCDPSSGDIDSGRACLSMKESAACCLVYFCKELLLIPLTHLQRTMDHSSEKKVQRRTGRRKEEQVSLAAARAIHVVLAELHPSCSYALHNQIMQAMKDIARQVSLVRTSLDSSTQQRSQEVLGLLEEVLTVEVCEILLSGALDATMQRYSTSPSSVLNAVEEIVQDLIVPLWKSPSLCNAYFSPTPFHCSLWNRLWAWIFPTSVSPSESPLSRSREFKSPADETSIRDCEEKVFHSLFHDFFWRCVLPMQWYQEKLQPLLLEAFSGSASIEGGSLGNKTDASPSAQRPITSYVLKDVLPTGTHLPTLISALLFVRKALCLPESTDSSGLQELAERSFWKIPSVDTHTLKAFDRHMLLSGTKNTPGDQTTDAGMSLPVQYLPILREIPCMVEGIGQVLLLAFFQVAAVKSTEAGAPVNTDSVWPVKLVGFPEPFILNACLACIHDGLFQVISMFKQVYINEKKDYHLSNEYILLLTHTLRALHLTLSRVLDVLLVGFVAQKRYYHLHFAHCSSTVVVVHPLTAEVTGSLLRNASEVVLDIFTALRSEIPAEVLVVWKELTDLLHHASSAMDTANGICGLEEEMQLIRRVLQQVGGEMGSTVETTSEEPSGMQYDEQGKVSSSPSLSQLMERAFITKCQSGLRRFYSGTISDDGGEGRLREKYHQRMQDAIQVLEQILQYGSIMGRQKESATSSSCSSATVQMLSSNKVRQTVRELLPDLLSCVHVVMDVGHERHQKGSGSVDSAPQTEVDRKEHSRFVQREREFRDLLEEVLRMAFRVVDPEGGGLEN